MGGRPDARVNPARDCWFLDRRADADADAVAALGSAELEESAGSGGHEIRSWLIGQAAVARPLVWTGYEPVPEWITGIGTTFPVA